MSAVRWRERVHHVPFGIDDRRVLNNRGSLPAFDFPVVLMIQEGPQSYNSSSLSTSTSSPNPQLGGILILKLASKLSSPTKSSLLNGLFKFLSILGVFGSGGSLGDELEAA